ncbi:MAG: SPOR domain-containing protein [Terracidiphilus sp.]
MSEDRDKADSKEIAQRRDTELTLGPSTLLVLFFVLALVCGFCFGLGYSMGSRSASAAANQPAMAITVSGGGRKPSATQQNIPQAPPVRAVIPVQGGGAGFGSAPARQEAAPAPGPEAAQTSGWTVRPALPAQAAQTAPAPAGQPQPALPQTPATAPPLSLMVQIAAISHDEDAAVLVSALRKHGYSVNAHREPGDNLIHVRIGPFTNRPDADSMRQKLLNDGYNAVIQQ